MREKENRQIRVWRESEKERERKEESENWEKMWATPMPMVTVEDEGGHLWTTADVEGRHMETTAHVKGRHRWEKNSIKLPCYSNNREWIEPLFEYLGGL